MSTNRRARLERLERANRSPAEPSQAASTWHDLLAWLLCEIGESEVEGLQAAIHQASERGYDENHRLDDPVLKALVLDLAHRIEERAKVPAPVRPFMRMGRDQDGVWSLESEIDFVRRGLAQDFELCGSHADLSDITVDDMAELIGLRIGGQGVAIGFTLTEIGRENAEQLCARIGVDLLSLPGVAEEIAGRPASHTDLYEHWKRFQRSAAGIGAAHAA